MARLILSLILIFVILFLTKTVNSLMINEFMPAPIDNCLQCSEWIEITSEEETSLENISIDTGESTRSILNGVIGKGEFIIVTKNASAFLNLWNFQNITIFENTKMRLADDGDNITLYNGSFVLQHIEYTKSIKNVSYGFCNNTLIQQKIPTPGLPNICFNEENQTNESNVCDIAIEIQSPFIFNAAMKNLYYIILNDTYCLEKDIILEYWIEDIFGNEAKEAYSTQQNFRCFKNISREWTPKESETSVYFIKARLINYTCNDTNEENNYAEKMIVMKGGEKETSSFINITQVVLGSDKKANFGDIIEVKLNIYKGNTSKNSVDIWLEGDDEKILGKTNFNIYTKFSNYSLSIPLILNPNCNSAFKNGVYKLKVKGLDAYDEKDIMVDGTSSLCQIIKENCVCSCPPCLQKIENKTEVFTKKFFEIISYPEEVGKYEDVIIKIFLNITQPKNITAYSYIYDGNKIVSLGFDGNRWLNTWTANRQKISLNGTSNITLVNRISKEAQPGKYKLKIKILHDEKEDEIIKDITIKEENFQEFQNQTDKTNLTNNITIEEGNKKEEIKIPSGRLVYKEENWFLSTINSIINFFKNLLKI